MKEIIQEKILDNFQDAFFLKKETKSSSFTSVKELVGYVGVSRCWKNGVFSVQQKSPDTDKSMPSGKGLEGSRNGNIPY